MKRPTQEQRREIIDLYSRDPAAATALAVSLGRSPLYARRIATEGKRTTLAVSGSGGHHIIQAVLAKHQISAKEFYGPLRHRKLWKARADAIQRLRRSKGSVRWIARFMKRDVSTITYHLYPKAKATRVERQRRYWAGEQRA